MVVISTLVFLTAVSVFIFAQDTPSQPTNARQIEKKILDDILGSEAYDPRIRPSGTNSTAKMKDIFCQRGTPTWSWKRCDFVEAGNENIDAATLVFVNIFVRGFSKIDDVKMEYHFQITLRQSWNDGRLQFKQKLAKGYQDKIKYLTMTDVRKVWMPDTFFRNEKIGRFHNILTPNLYVRVFPNGDILYSIRVSLIVTCSMHLALFPFDEQTCYLYVASYGWTMNDLIYVWKDQEALQFANNISLPGGFKMGDTGQDYCDVKTATGEYSCLQVDLVFCRELSYFMVTMYIPCFMIVVVSWFAFWIDHKAAPARVTLGVTTLLAMSTTMASIQKSLPPVAYTKAIDVWSGVCVFFVFLSLMEYALVNYAARTDAQRATEKKKRKDKEIELLAMAADNNEFEDQDDLKDPLLRRVNSSKPILTASIIPSPTPSRLSHKFQFWMDTWKFGAKKIDVLSRSIFPLCFSIFNISYWSYYLNQKADTES